MDLPKEFLILFIGLCLQALIYKAGPIGPFLTNAPWLSFGRGLLLGVLWANFGLGMHKVPEKQRKSIKFKLILFSGLLFLTLTNQLGIRFSDAVLTCLFILLPAVFWTTRAERESKVMMILFLIAILSFMSFFIQWTGIIYSWHGANPFLWIIAFGAAISLSFAMKESK